MSGYIVQFFGIYPDEIEHATVVADEACIEAGLSEDDIDFDFEDDIAFCLKHFGNWEDITNSIIEAYFYKCKAVCYEKFGLENVKVDWYINGWDTHFYVERLDDEKAMRDLIEDYVSGQGYDCKPEDIDEFLDIYLETLDKDVTVFDYDDLSDWLRHTSEIDDYYETSAYEWMDYPETLDQEDEE